MKVGDLVKRIRSPTMSPRPSYEVFLVMKVEQHVVCDQVIWLYPDPDGNPDYDHTDDDNYYFKDFFEVVSESR
jgi:hypothetical protein